MRIVDVNEFYSPTGGGVRTYCDRKMAILAEMGHELIVVAPGTEDRVEDRAGGGSVVYVRSPKMPFDANYGVFWDEAAIHAVLDRYDPDVVENCSPWRAAWFVLGWQGRAIRSFFMHNDNMEAYPKRWLGRFASAERIERAFAWYDRYTERFLRRYDTVVTNGPATTARMLARGVRIDATMTLGIERRYFSPALHNDALRVALLDQCGLPPSGHLLLGIGRHHAEKRWPLVIDAVLRAGATLPVGLVILGQGMDSKALERRIGDSPHIRLFRPVYDRERLAEIMASVDAFIHGNDTETFGLVGYEALACGAPLIVPDAGGMAALAAAEYSETYRGGDAHDCADAIQRLFARDQGSVHRAAIDAAAKVRSDVDHAARLVDHYAGVIAAKNARGPCAPERS